MKCSICGSENLFEISIINNQVLRTEGYVSQTVLSYACEDCGHIELYAPQEMINKRKESIKFEKEREIKLINLNEKIAGVNDDINKLKTIIADENQKVKTVNEAKNKLNEAESELKKLQSELSFVKNQRYGVHGRREGYWGDER